MASRILVVDDEPAVTDLLSYNLRRAGYDVTTAGDGRTGLQYAQELHPDLILLDLMLPEIDGLDVCRELRKTGDVPIIMITARDEEIDRVVGLELGADDYVAKPFSVRELMARIKAVLRRTQGESHATSPNLLHGPDGLVMDTDSRSVTLGEAPLALTRLEFDLLALLVAHNGRVITRERLLEQAWGYAYVGDTRAVDSAIKRLRAKMHAASPKADLIETVRGIGYRVCG
jgi:DNA-binding response OmpR family regulator